MHSYSCPYPEGCNCGELQRAELARYKKALIKLSKLGLGAGGGLLDPYSQGVLETEAKVRKIAREALSKE